MKEQKIIIALLTVLALVAIGTVLYLLQTVLLPFVLAMFLSFLFKPVVLFLRKRRVPMALALIVVMLVIAGMLYGVSMVLVGSANAFIAALPRYEAKMVTLSEDLLAAASGVASNFGMSLSDFNPRDALSQVAPLLSTGFDSLVSLLSNGFMILLFLIFMLAGSGSLTAKVAMAFPPERARAVAEVIGHIDDRVRRYMLVKTLVSALTGALVAGILAILGVDFALLWGFLTFLLNFIPNVGSLFATVFPVLIALLQFDSPVTALLALVLLIVVQNLVGNVLEPKLMAFSLNLSPLLILASLIFWGWLWGVWGMILAVPLMSMIKIVFEQFDELRPYAMLMSGSGQRESGRAGQRESGRTGQ